MKISYETWVLKKYVAKPNLYQEARALCAVPLKI